MAQPDTRLTEAMRQAAVLLEANYVVGMTGAGISVESGIPPFRGQRSVDQIRRAPYERL